MYRIASVETWLEETTKDKKQEILQNYDGGIVNYHKLPLKFFTGWMKF
jgi:hypothetical protein